MKKTEKKCCCCCAHHSWVFGSPDEFFCYARVRRFKRDHVCRYFLPVLPFDA